MRWKLIIEEYGRNIQNKYGVENIVSDTPSRFLSTWVDQDEPSTSRGISQLNELFVTIEEEIIYYGLDIVHQEKQK